MQLGKRNVAILLILVATTATWSCKGACGFVNMGFLFHKIFFASGFSRRHQRGMLYAQVQINWYRHP
jgi:hypothetical protein